MYEDITELRGKEKGPTSIILAGVHGDERCGVEILKKTLLNLEIASGRVLFGYGNPKAIEVNRRFTEANLNRMFKDTTQLSKDEKQSYEYARAQFLKTYLDQADALLDIHASFTPRSTPFIICEMNAKDIVKYLPVDLVVSGFDNVEPGGTDHYMNRTGKIGICVECGYLNDPKSIQTAEESIIAFLKARGHLPNNIPPKKQSHIRVYDLYTTETNNFTLSKPFNDFEELLKDQIIGTDGKNDVFAQKESVILFARNVQEAGDEAFLLGEKKGSLA